MAQNAEIKAQEETFELSDKSEPVPPPDIVAYNELRSCADLLRLHTSGKLEIQPDFQREVVWRADDQSRFIDSLVKQLPIPSMCFSLDYKTQRWKVIDGLQRMSSIIRFLSETEWRLSDLSDIHPRLKSASNIELRNGSDEQKRLYSLVEDVSIPVTVIRCDYTQRNHMRYLFTIFHRLNSGGMRLTNQEIRNCIFTSPYNDLLKSIDEDNPAWKTVKKRIWGSMDRFRSAEVLLRVMAFGDKWKTYDGNLAGFLNDYMEEKAKLPLADMTSFRAKLERTVLLTQRTLSAEVFRKLSLSLVESVLVAIYVNNLKEADWPQARLGRAYLSLKQQPSFAESARYAITSVENVKKRLEAAIATFAA